MGDVADILGLAKAPVSTPSEEASKILSVKQKFKPKLSEKPKGMSREVFSLLGVDGIAPAVQSSNRPPAFKSKWKNSLKGKWVWASIEPFSARSDKEVLFHWVKADVNYADYPYSRFNLKSELVTYSDDEYDTLLQSPDWTRSETDHLMYLCYKFDARWPVIVDRYVLIPLRTTEDLQQRYYSIITKLKGKRSGSTDSSIRNEIHSIFDFEYERSRRTQQEILFRRSREDEIEENKLREELKVIESNLKKIKKTSKASGQEKLNSLGDLPPDIYGKGMVVTSAVGGAAVGITVEPPTAGRPRLQSERLVPIEFTVGIAKSLSRKAAILLQELGMPELPLPTKTVCDLVDQVRKDAVALLSLQNALAKREKELAAIKQQAQIQSSQPAAAVVGTTIPPLTAPSGTASSSTPSKDAQGQQVSLYNQSTIPLTAPTALPKLITKYKTEEELVIPHAMLTSKGDDYTAAPTSVMLSVAQAAMPKKPSAPKRKISEVSLSSHVPAESSTIPIISSETPTKPPAKRKK